MSNSYFTATGTPSTGSAMATPTIRTEFAAIDTGFTAVETAMGLKAATASVASLAANTFTGAQNWATGTAIASAATVNLDTATGNRVHITGTTTITAWTLTRGPRTVIFDGACALTYHATTNRLNSGATNYTTAAGDMAVIESNGTTVYVNITKVAGSVTPSGVESLTNKTITDIVFALTGTTPAFTATNGAVQAWSLTAASTPTNALTTGQSIILVVTPGANAITWPTIVWTKVGGSGAAPTLFTSGKTTVILWMVGTVLYGSHLGDTA